MPTVIERLQAEHGRLGRLVQLLNDERSLRTDPGAPKIALLVDALYYLTRFPDVAHHAIEDRIAEKLRGKNALSGELAREIEAQYVTLISQGHERRCHVKPSTTQCCRRRLFAQKGDGFWASSAKTCHAAKRSASCLR